MSNSQVNQGEARRMKQCRLCVIIKDHKCRMNQIGAITQSSYWDERFCGKISVYNTFNLRLKIVYFFLIEKRKFINYHRIHNDKRK